MDDMSPNEIRQNGKYEYTGLWIQLLALAPVYQTRVL